MRHLIILPGNSLKNKTWGEAALSYYSLRYDSIFMLEYDHWVSGETNIDFTTEEAKLAAHVATLPTDVDVVLFAKSAGSLLALSAIQHAVITPTRCVFFGMPLDLAANGIFKDSWEPLASLRIPTVAFHNLEDPTTSYEFTKKALLKQNPAITFITTDQLDHWYADFTTYDQYISEKDQ